MAFWGMVRSEENSDSVSAKKLRAWIESELVDNEKYIAWETEKLNPSAEFASELEGRKWAYPLVRQFIDSGAGTEGGAVCGACGAREMIVMTGQLVCLACLERRASECSMIPADSKLGKEAVDSRRRREKAGAPEHEL